MISRPPDPARHGNGVCVPPTSQVESTGPRAGACAPAGCPSGQSDEGQNAAEAPAQQQAPPGGTQRQEPPPPASGKIVGRATDAQTGRPLPNVNVVVGLGGHPAGRRHLSRRPLRRARGARQQTGAAILGFHENNYR